MAALMMPDPKPDCDVIATRDGYNRWAEIYDTEDNALIALEEPQVIAMLGDVRGLSVVDVGCGTGRHAIRLAAEGAKVTALDFSEGMMERARSKPGWEKITLLHHDLAQPLPFPGGAFDRVLCCLVIEHIREPEFLFRELGRVCRADGRMVVSAMHPAMMLRGVSARFTDPVTGRDTRPQSHPATISDYVMAAIRSGLAIDMLSEHAVDAALAARSPRAAKYLDWPMLMMMALRPAGS